MIQKELFTETINAIMIQVKTDIKNAELISEAFNSEMFILYDNSRLINALINLLSVYFDKSELQHYCFEKNFGRIGDEYESPEELYDRLISQTVKI
jgi:hypothetical protein